MVEDQTVTTTEFEEAILDAIDQDSLNTGSTLSRFSPKL